MDYEETLLHLDSIVDTYATVYPIEEVSGDEPDELRPASALWTAGRFKRDSVVEEEIAAGLRQVLAEIGENRPDVGDDTLQKLAEPQSAHFTFEGMDDQFGRFAGFSLTRDTFRESRWVEVWFGKDSLWIRTFGGDLVVNATFPNAPRSLENPRRRARTVRRWLKAIRGRE